MNTVLNPALTLTYNQLSTFAGSDNFWNLFDTTFGTQYNRSAAEILRLQWLSGDFSQLPQIEILDNSTLGNANGAYASSTNKIYLSNSFLATSTTEAISAVLLEEIGHFIDAQINQIDTLGDEGEKFSALVRGQNLTTQELSRINTENDSANITLGGEQVAVEQNTPIVLTVTTTADQNDGSATGGLSLRDAILIANADTTNDYIIELQGGQTYSLVHYSMDTSRASLHIQGNVTIRAVGNEPAIIDGSQLTYTSSFYTFGNDIFRVHAQRNLTLDNITVTKATNTAINIASNASVLMQNSTVSYSWGPFSYAYENPGIENRGTLTLQNSSVHDNRGNGIINYGGATATILDSDIYNNKALGELTISGSGGGILNYGSVVLENSWIYNNQGELGSGISNKGSFTGINSVIAANSGSSGILNGGSLDDGTLNLINTAIIYNSSSFVEGAGLNNVSGTANLINTTISNNTMSGYYPQGGGIYNGATLNLVNSTIANNTATRGGGIYVYGGQITLKNTIIAGNNANSGQDIYGSVTGNNNNLIGNLTGANGTVGTGTDIVNPNPGLGTLQYIGNTYIHPLLAGSPAINAGNNSLIPADTQDLDSDQNTTEIIPFDQRNLLRIFGTTVDIGAVEMSNGSGTNILPEVEGNNTFATAQVIANTSFNRQLVADIQDFNGSNISTTYDHVSILGTGDGTFDFYRFNAPANTQLVFDIDNNNFDTILRLWNPNTNQLLALNDNGIEIGNTGNSRASFLTGKTLATSDYVIGVYRYSSSGLTPPTTGDSYTLHFSISNDVSPSITLSVSPSSVLEDGTTNLVYTFTRTGITTSALTVNYSIAGIANSTDYTGATPGTGKTITFAAGASTATLTINPTADTTIETNETVALTLATGTGYTLGTTTAVTGTITNDDVPVINLSANQSIVEGFTSPQNLVYTVTLSSPSAQSITVQYATANGTATAASDYTSTSGTLTFNPGVTTQVINIPILNNSINEANETFILTLSSPTNANLGTTRTVTTTITDTLTAAVTTTLPANVENLTLTGTAAINGAGNAGNNVITGNTANNLLNGALGIDTLIGGTGNDIYVVDTTTDVITENVNEGTDTIQSSVNFTIATLTNIENLTLTGTGTINGVGNDGNNVITGNTANNILNGGAGNDILNDSTGIDTLIGGVGNDVYVVDTTTDVITENVNEGTDRIQSSVTFSLTTLPNVENLTLTGTGTINGTGNAGNNVIIGNTANNILNGGLGNDILNGGLGNDILISGAEIDTLIGGTGIDRFDYRNLANSVFNSLDVITDFNANASNDLFLVSTARSVFNNVGTVATFDTAGIAAKLTTTSFTANAAAQFTFGSRTFVAINDATAGFSATTDAIVEVTGLTGTLGIGNFTTALV